MEVREKGTGLKRQVTRSLCRDDPVVRYPKWGVRALEVTHHHQGSEQGLFLRAVPQRASSSHKPGDANPHLFLDDLPGSSTLPPLTRLLGLTQEEEGDILLFLTIVLTLPL